MSRPSKVTMVVVTFREDLDLLDRLLDSMHQHWRLDQIHEVLIIFNDFYRYYDSSVRSILDTERPGLVIRTMWANELVPEQDDYSWYSQQLFKLMAAEHVNTEWYIIHDSKDYYVGACDIDRYFMTDGRALGCMLPNTGNHRGNFNYFERQYNNARDIWGMGPLRYNQALLRYVTPFTARRDTIRGMITDLRSKLGGMFRHLINLQLDHRPMFTEFALIDAWARHSGSMETDYWNHTTRPQPDFNELVQQDKDLRRTPQ